MVLVVVWVFLITSEFEYKPVDSPSYRTPENIVVSVISPIIFFLLACVYRPPGPEVVTLLIFGDFNVLVDISSKDSVKLTNFIASCNIIQYIQTSTHLHGHILDIILTPNNLNCVSHVKVGEFISNHALIKCKVDFSSWPVTKSRLCSSWGNYKISMPSFRHDLRNCSFVKSPGSTVSVVYDRLPGLLYPKTFVRALLINKKNRRYFS